MSARPARRALSAAITFPMSFMPEAPDSATSARSLRAAFSNCAIDSRRCLIILSITDTTSASERSMRSSTSLCFSAASSRRMADRRAASLARIAAFMSSVICCLSGMEGARLNSVHLLRQHLAAQTLVVALYGGGELAFALGGRLFVVLAGAQLGEQAGLLHGALEATHGHLERLVFLDAYCRHPALSLKRGLNCSRIGQC